jgi:hypothetical protein
MSLIEPTYHFYEFLESTGLRWVVAVGGGLFVFGFLFRSEAAFEIAADVWEIFHNLVIGVLLVLLILLAVGIGLAIVD